jgi:hypothetical protein
MVDRSFAENVTSGETRVARAYDDCREALDRAFLQATSTVTSVGFVSASNTADRF